MEKRTVIRAAVGFALYLFLAPIVLFLCAGTTRWFMAWLYIISSFVAVIVSRMLVLRRSPETLRERARFVSSEGTKSWDRILAPLVAVYGPVIVAVVAGFDHRFAWGPSMPLAVQVIAAVLVFCSYGIAVWAMAVNPFFSAAVRVQDDRGHHVITVGPYRGVRHPSYAAALLAGFALPFMLDALWALVPTFVLAIALIVRTALEDQTLLSELDGYQEYAQRTRYRLLPGIW